MRLFTKAALGGGMVSTATVVGLTLGGAFAGSALVVVDPLAPAARADELVPFDDCASLREWYVSRAIKEVGPYGWGGGMIAYDMAVPNSTTTGSLAMAPMPSMAMAGSAEDAGRTSSGTGTNTQEADVDEPDIAKTDGRLVVRLVQEDTLVITDVTGAVPRELGRVDLGGRAGYGGELLLLDDHVLVVNSLPGGWAQPLPMVDGPTDVAPESSFRPGGLQQGGTRITDVDISDPSAPQVSHTDQYNGRLISARTYGDTVRLVTTTDRPELSWTYPGKGVSDGEATRRNRALVRATPVETWLPAVRTGGRTTPLVECADVLHPSTWAGAGTIAVTTFPGADVEDRSSVAITAGGELVYSSTDRLYVASSRLPEPSFYRRLAGDLTGDTSVFSPEAMTTDLHAFALDGDRTRYAGSGTVRGYLRDRWSLDSYDGVLRVAWTRTDRKGGTRNGVTTMTEKDGRLVELGEIGDLGIDENIQSVRWFDDFAVVVTFRQMDPLYTIDLSDPARPTERGALKIPGYSGYLHPIGEDRLLGLGVDATAEGRSTGAQAATFDVSDLADPSRTDHVGFRDSDFAALQDPRGFSWLPDQQTGITSISDWQTGRSRLVALRVAPSGAITVRTLAPLVGGWQTRTLPLADGRIAVVDAGATNGVRVLDID